MSVTSNTHLNSHTTQGNKLEPLDLPSSLDRWETHHPCIPFYRRLFSPLTPKTVLKFNGRVLKHPSRFSVNLIVETKSGSDNAFHFNPRFDEHCIVCNSRHDKSWDEQLTFKPNPLQKNTNFCLEIFLTSDEYFVSVNRNHFCRFPHRIPFTEVNKIDVTGDVILFSVEQTKRDFYPPSAVSNNEHLHDKLIIPYMRAFLDTIIPSTVINIRGIIPEKAVRFRVDFLTGWTEGADIAFHFNPRFDDNFIACNSKHDGKWATEEPNGFLQLPFKRGHSFSLDVFAAENEFQVSLCGKFLFKFMYRISISKIKLLSINGDIELRSVNFTSAASPVKCKETQSFVFDNLVVPFCRAFLDPIVPKTDILICGTVAKEAIKFTINFCLDPLRGGDIAFHFNPRFDQNYVARNSLLKDHWGNEEAHAIKRNPFKRGEPFILEFFVTRHEFLVSVNGSHFCSYTHRVPPLEIQQIEIDGDLSLKRVELSTKDFYPSAVGIAEDLAISDAMECPITYQLPGELAFGRMIRIDGKVKLLPSVFYVNVQAGRLYWPHPQVGFHTSVRFIETGGSAVTTHRPTVILNSWQDTSWGPEKELQLTDLALLPGSSFCLIVNCGPNAFNATLNNRPLGKVKYFMELKGLNILHIQGDIVINSIQVT